MSVKQYISGEFHELVGKKIRQGTTWKTLKENDRIEVGNKWYRLDGYPSGNIVEANTTTPEEPGGDTPTVGPSATSYDNPLGKGDRTLSVTASCGGLYDWWESQDPQTLIDGIATGARNTGVMVSEFASNLTDATMTFDLGQSRYVDEIKLSVSGPPGQTYGSWNVFGSNDGETWSDALCENTSFTSGIYSLDDAIFSITSAIGYRYYQLKQLTPNATVEDVGPMFNEVEFKIDAGV